MFSEFLTDILVIFIIITLYEIIRRMVNNKRKGGENRKWVIRN